MRILIAASGSGGHLIPALLIAQAISKHAPEAQVEFIGSGRPLEEEILVKNGFVRHIIPATGLMRGGVAGVLRFMGNLPAGVWRVWNLLSAFKPQVVVGVGGYVTFLPVTIAKLRGIPTWIHEPELKPGLANRILARYAQRISLGFRDAALASNPRAVFTGHPVRAEFAAAARSARRVEKPSRIFVTGGSQGADSLDCSMLELSSFLAERGIEVWHQCRAANVEKLIAGYAASGLRSRVASFIPDTSCCYDWADLVIARSGVGTVNEIAVVNRPVIFVPYPFAQGNHQKANAETLSREGKALIVEEGAGFTARLKAAVENLLQPQQYNEMLLRPCSARVTDAAERIARGCLEMCR